MRHTLTLCLLMLLSFAATPASADIVQFNFVGNAGNGLLPDNEVGAGTAFGSGSTASGGEAATGVTFDTDSKLLAVIFNFQGLTDGLDFSAGSGIHLHAVSDPSDAFNSTGGVVYNLNSFADANVINFNTQIADGETSGTVTAIVTAGALETELLNGELYLNIHSQAFPGGELRANLVAVPEPATGLILFGGMLAGIVRRRR